MTMCELQEEKCARPAVLTREQALCGLRESVERSLSSSSSTPLAFYSSAAGGIVTEKDLMVIPLDDHIVHRGHAVFDTCLVFNGRAYQLDHHLDRLLSSAAIAGIKPTQTRAELRNIILTTAAVPGLKDVDVRCWLTVGRGGFGCGPSECKKNGSSFYCVVSALPPNMNEKYTKGARLVTATVPLKPGMFATVKSTNYLPNAMICAEADAAGATHAIWVDDSGNVAESAVANIAVVVEGNRLAVPKFDHTLAGVTIRRLMQLAEKLDIVTAVEQRDISLAEAKAAKEVMLVGSTTNALSVVQWDGKDISDGKPGPIARALRLALESDKFSDGSQLVDVPGLVDNRA